MKLNVFDKFIIEVIYTANGWQAFYLGNERKKRRANDIVIPDDISEDKVVGYLTDLFHEAATPAKNEIKIIS